MEYEEAFSLYKLNKLEAEELVSIADEWLERGVYTESLDELYTMRNPIMAEVGSLFEKTMLELDIKEPTRIEAANNIVRITLKKIISKEIMPEKGASFLYWKVHHEIVEEFPDKQYLGDNLGLQNIFCWLREIWDCRDGSMILYHRDLSRAEAEKKFHEHLVEAVKNRENDAT